MILGKSRKQRRLIKPHKWFAWYPVYIGDNQSAWLCNVWRFKIISDEYEWIYRLTQEECVECYEQLSDYDHFKRY